MICRQKANPQAISNSRYELEITGYCYENPEVKKYDLPKAPKR